MSNNWSNNKEAIKEKNKLYGSKISNKFEQDAHVEPERDAVVGGQRQNPVVVHHTAQGTFCTV
jgi:hypothetical protein